MANRAVTRAGVEELRPTAQAFVDLAFDRAASSGEMELMADLANAMPVRIMCEWMALPSEDFHRIEAWSEAIHFFLGGKPSNAAMLFGAWSALQECSAYLRDTLASRRRHPGRDLLSSLIADREANAFEQDQAATDLAVLLLGGVKTTSYMIGNAVLSLLACHEQADALRRDLSLVDNALDELTRYSGPTQGVQRVVVEPLILHGRMLAPGEPIHVLVGAANRDPRRFENPAKLDITRSNCSQHLGFGHGIHYCIGALLSRMQAAITITTMLNRFPAIRLARDFVPAWTDSLGLQRRPVFRGVEVVRLSL
jgi:cytochrome P450